jgi:hypothetical protein
MQTGDIQKAAASAKSKILTFFIANVNKVLSSDEIREVAGISEWARRVRELRDEDGWPILTHNDRSDLKPGEYLLISTTRGASAQRLISKELRAKVLARDGSVCQVCGAAAGEMHPVTGKRVTMHIGHIISKISGGSDDESNLRAECMVCNTGGGNVTAAPPEDFKNLKTVINKAGRKAKVLLYEWLWRFFNGQTPDELK